MKTEDALREARECLATATAFSSKKQRDRVSEVLANIDAALASADKQEAGDRPEALTDGWCIKAVAEVDALGEVSWLVKWDRRPAAGTKLYVEIQP